MNTAQQTATEAEKALDAIAVVSSDLACHCDAPPHTLVLPAKKLQEACATIDEAVSALKKILALTAKEPPAR